MSGRLVIVLVVIFIFIAGVWLARRPSSYSVEHQNTASVPLPIIPKPATPPIISKKTAAPQKAVLPKPAAVPVPIPVMPMIPAPALQTRPTLPVMPIVPVEPLPQEWKGNNDTSIQHTGQIVVQTDEQWIHFWAEHHPDEAAPEIDFSRNIVVGVFLGERPADNFGVTITGIRTQGNALIVDYLQIDPPVGTYQVGMNSFPYDIKVIPRSKLHVTFKQLTPQDQRPVPAAVKK